MTEMTSQRVLVEAAKRALENLPEPRWNCQDGTPVCFTLWASGRSISIQAKKGVFFMDPDTTFMHFLELYPEDRKAFFYENSGLQEKRRIVENNLTSMGYVIEERPLRWFNSTYAERGDPVCS